MKFVVAIDSLKGCLTSLEAGTAARDGILSASPNSHVKIFPSADGGVLKSVEVIDSPGKKISRIFGLVIGIIKFCF